MLQTHHVEYRTRYYDLSKDLEERAMFEALGVICSLSTCFSLDDPWRQRQGGTYALARSLLFWRTSRQFVDKPMIKLDNFAYHLSGFLLRCLYPPQSGSPHCHRHHEA